MLVKLKEYDTEPNRSDIHMYKVLVVDDEMYVRKGIINLIDWAELSFSICGEAENGIEALQFIEQIKPDLVLVDIRMPVCDGLELIRRVREEGEYQPEFIVISGYHDFSYAQQALRFHVSDYIVKPVDEFELRKALSKISTVLMEKQLISLTNEKPLDNSLLDTLVNGVQNETALSQISQQLHLPLDASYSYLLIECHNSLYGDINYKQTILQKVEESAKQHEHLKYIKFHQQQNKLIGCVVQTSELLHSLSVSEDEVWRFTKEWIEEQLLSEITLYIGITVQSLAELTLSYKQSYEAINHKYAEYDQGYIKYSEIVNKSLYYFDLPNELYAKILLLIEEGNIEETIELTEYVFNKFKDERYAPSAVQNALTRITISIINTIRQMNGDENNIKELQTALNWHNEFTHPLQIKAFFKQFFELAASYISQLRGASAKGSVDKVKQYIDAHYTENINLKSIAAKFYMNSVYLGQLFRKSYGTYFNDYLLTLRIDLAKKLLRTTDLRMYEIAEQVGFQNADYFVTQFEKKENLTPTDYRNQLMGKK